MNRWIIAGFGAAAVAALLAVAVTTVSRAGHSEDAATNTTLFDVNAEVPVTQA
ncbi:hypothetical protein AB0M02_12225 [Actinoplanes sp. NPDC051861]|uniref:hypothetical protein n=1 Tax=Actinoplanes sp. NPDC051861 TaxID=3155170 RepID=UPI00343ED214